MLIYLEFLIVMSVVSYITSENIVLYKKSRPQLPANSKNEFQRKLTEIQTKMLLNSVKEKLLLSTLKKKIANDLLRDYLKKMELNKQAVRSQDTSYEDSSASQESNSDEYGEGNFRDMTRVNNNKINIPTLLRRDSSNHVKDEKVDRGKLYLNSYVITPSETSNKNNRYIYRKFASKKPEKNIKQKHVYSTPLQNALKKLNLTESDTTSDSNQSGDVNKLNEDEILLKGRVDRAPKRFEVIQNQKNPYAQYSSSSEKFSEEVTTTKAPKRKKKKKRIAEINEADSEIFPDPQPLTDTEVPSPKKHEKKEVYIQGPGRIIKTGDKSSSSHSDENFRRGDIGDDVIEELFPGVEENDLKKHIVEVMRTVNDEKGKRKKRSSRKRMQHFLPKRIHWKREDLKDLGYFWFNGPQGKFPGTYRIRY